MTPGLVQNEYALGGSTAGVNMAMIGVFVTFRYEDNFDEQAVRKIAENARATFEGMPGLRDRKSVV